MDNRKEMAEIVKAVLDGTYKPTPGEGPVFTRSDPLATAISAAIEYDPTLLESAKPAIVKEFGEDKYDLADEEQVTYALMRLIRRAGVER